MQKLHEVKVGDHMGFLNNVIYCTHNGVCVYILSTQSIVVLILVSCPYYKPFHIPLRYKCPHKAHTSYTIQRQKYPQVHNSCIVARLWPLPTLPTITIVGSIQGSLKPCTSCASWRLSFQIFRFSLEMQNLHEVKVANSLYVWAIS